MILNIDPHLRMGRKDEALLQEKFLAGIGKTEQVRAEQSKQSRCQSDSALKFPGGSENLTQHLDAN